MDLQSDHISGNSFLDEGHQSLMHLINTLADDVRLGVEKNQQSWQDIQARATHYIKALEEHFQHEELILKGADFELVVEHIKKHRDTIDYLHRLAAQTFTKQSALYFVASARSRVFAHELLEDQDYWSLFEDQETAGEPLIFWSPRIETGKAEVDTHHRALVNFINRLHARATVDADPTALANELEGLYAYAEFHFTQEQAAFEHHLSPEKKALHAADHQHLLADLRTVIGETSAGTYSAAGVGGYLKYWFLNHLMAFDKPAFEGDG